MNKFTLYWRTGDRVVIEGEGDTPADACNRNGIGGGAIRALDFWARGDDTDYTWNPTTREWDRVTPLE